MNGNRKKTGVVNDEVEELLRAAEDAALLKLSVNSHTVHASSSDLDPDLEQRFRALKSGPKPSTKSKVLPKQTPPPQTDKVKQEVGEEDLFVRFSALKASLPNSSSSISSAGINTSDVSKLAGAGFVDDDDDEEDEVEKIIRWAKDAARLDPSPLFDEDDDIKDDDDDSDDDDDDVKSDDDGNQEKNKKGHRK